jgi:hypothetical protein
MDAETLKSLVKQQKEAEERLKSNTEEQKKWNIDDQSEDYKMESDVFDYEKIRKDENFGIKKYADAIFRG